MKAALQEHFGQGKPIYAECGGMLYLLESVANKAGECGNMVGLMPGRAVMQNRLKGLGYQSAPCRVGITQPYFSSFDDRNIASPYLIRRAFIQHVTW